MSADIVGNIDHVPTRNAIKVVDLLDARAGLLRAGDALDEVALDKYTFTRDAYLQRRRNAVFDGDPPDEPAAP
jgi:phospholipid-binding lipoprotein MlaA